LPRLAFLLTVCLPPGRRWRLFALPENFGAGRPGSVPIAGCGQSPL